MSESVVRPETPPPDRAPVSPLALWAGVLTAPVAFLVLLEVTYALASWACTRGGEWVLHLACAGAAAAAVWALAHSWRSWSAAGRQWPDTGADAATRSRLLALLGVAGSGYFLLVILAHWITVVVLSPCARA